VIAIIAILAALVLPAVTSISRSYQMTAAGHTVLNILVQARQAAITRGYPVQVRIYKLPDYNQPNSSAPAVYRALQAFVEGDPVSAGGSSSAPLTPLSRASFFSSPVQILEAKSSLLTLPSTASPAETLSGYGKNYSYVSFRFKPSGQADISTSTSGLVLAFSNDAQSGALPANFRALEIDPVTGAVRDYAP
jgi:uncharacterized protein (TIGR02596 family)